MLNKKERVRFYQSTPAGQEELKALRAQCRAVALGMAEIGHHDGRVRVP